MQFTKPFVSGLREDEDTALGKMLAQLAKVSAKNQLLTVYDEGHRAFRSFGISTPPRMKNVRAALSWPSKAVTALVRKHQFEGFGLHGETDPFEIDALLQANEFELELMMGIRSAYTHACAFITTVPGNPLLGEPEVVIQARDAIATTALWDKQKRMISAFLAITATDDYGAITGFTLMLPGSAVACERIKLGKWDVRRQEFAAQRVMAEMLPYDPTISRPFGRSRITREVRYLTDAAIRTLVRMETTAEFFSAPQRWAMNVDPDTFDQDKWNAVIGRLLAIEGEEGQESPSVGQFPQMSMEPHVSMYRQLAMNFCASTSIPQSSVGVFADNPASAQAMESAHAELADEGEHQWKVFNPRLKRIAQNVVLLRDDLAEPTDEMWKMTVKHKPCRYVSPQAAADFTVKAVGAIPAIGETTEALRGLGYSQEEIDSMSSEWRKKGAPSVLAELVAQRATPASSLVEVKDTASLEGR